MFTAGVLDGYLGTTDINCPLDSYEFGDLYEVVIHWFATYPKLLLSLLAREAAGEHAGL